MARAHVVIPYVFASCSLFVAIGSSRIRRDCSIHVTDIGCDDFQLYFDEFKGAYIPAFRLTDTYYNICNSRSGSVDAMTAKFTASDTEVKAKALFPKVEERKAFLAALPELLCKRFSALVNMGDIMQRMVGYKKICSSTPGISFRFFVARTELGTNIGGVGALFFEGAESTEGDECGEIQMKPFVYMVGMHKTPAELLRPHPSTSSIVPELEKAVANWAWSKGAAYVTAPRPLGPLPRKLAALGWVNSNASGLSAEALEAFAQNDCSLKFWLAQLREQLYLARLPPLGPDSPLKTNPYN
eukprot:TRINITY_DN9185_c0_g3_i1.p1 TRINITY_DN9185_c0_g3~~TRINITY_DN9185_c0_g3_i1.p1  ORF type:complete len:299 (+),score=20.42 TRINITY_DN9185_c0_g3_i1:302-1198(+)